MSSSSGSPTEYPPRKRLRGDQQIPPLPPSPSLIFSSPVHPSEGSVKSNTESDWRDTIQEYDLALDIGAEEEIQPVISPLRDTIQEYDLPLDFGAEEEIEQVGDEEVEEEPSGIGGSGTSGSVSSREYPPHKRLRGNEQSPPSASHSGIYSTGSGASGSGSGLPQEIVDYYNSIQNKLTGLDNEDLETLYSQGTEPYLFVERLGSGAFGDVWKGVKAVGRNTKHREEIAIKRILTDTPVKESGFEREINAVTKLSDYPHNNILFSMDFFDDFNFETHYIISELAPIGDLYQGLLQLDSSGQLLWHPLLPQYCRHLIKGISHGLQHLFQHGMTHGDIKLENILLFWTEPTHQPTSQSVQDLTLSRFMQMIPKLCDFSNAKMGVPGAPIMATSPHCTPYSAAPESYNGPFDLVVADVYSVGVCLLAMLLACHPFAPSDINIPADHYTIRTTQLKRSRKVINQLVTPFDYRLKQVLLRLLEPEPQNRITINEFLADEWFTHRIESHERDQPWSRTHWSGRPQDLWRGKSQ